ncbi:MAG: OmpW family protein [Deltaproteobacteria bacterium]|nr:OmpW family protein [Deltaproteobacteria bacterium]
MGKIAAAVLLVSSLVAPAAAAEGPLLVRVRGVYISTADKSDAIPALGINSKDVISVSKKLIPEVDISYFITPNLSAELILTYPQKHDVKVNANGTKLDLGTFSHLPPVLSVQWHFLPGGVVNPYVGLGVNLTLITSQDLAVPLATPLELEISKSSVGISGQLGVDVMVAPQWYLNADVKYVTLGVDVKVKSSGTKVSHATVDPWLLGLGVGYRF